MAIRGKSVCVEQLSNLNISVLLLLKFYLFARNKRFFIPTKSFVKIGIAEIFCYNKMFSSINKTFGCCGKIFGCSNKKISVAVTKPFFPCEVLLEVNIWYTHLKFTFRFQENLSVVAFMILCLAGSKKSGAKMEVLKGRYLLTGPYYTPSSRTFTSYHVFMSNTLLTPYLRW